MQINRLQCWLNQLLFAKTGCQFIYQINKLLLFFGLSVLPKASQRLNSRNTAPLSTYIKANVCLYTTKHDWELYHPVVC